MAVSDDPIARRFRGKRLKDLREAHCWEWASTPLILNHELRAEDLPGPDTSIDDLIGFALTYDGYVAFGRACGDLANDASERWARTGELPSLTLAELRACLFFEQRRHHWVSTDLARERPYWTALIEAIRAAMSSGTS